MSVRFIKENEVGTIEFDQPDSKVNLLSGDTLRRLDKLLDEVLVNEKKLKAFLFVSRKKDVFIAGADIKEIEKITEKKDGEEKAKQGQNIFNKIEDLPFPTVAVIDGLALGGGCELALSCTYRIATFNEKIKIGLPEVNLGILPGFGGTYRLPKVVGLTQALKIILAGKVISNIDAYKIGLFDRLYPQKGLEQHVQEFVSSIQGKNRKDVVPPRKMDRMTKFLENNSLGRSVLFKKSRESVLQATKGFYPSPLKTLSLIQRTYGTKRAFALDQEAKAFSELAVTDISKNLVQVFYLSEKYKKYMPPGTENIKPKKIAKCAVIGAGVMGGGIAQLLSSRGIFARIKDINFDAISKGYSAANKVYREALKKRKLKKHEVERGMGLITGTLDYSGFQNQDMVIEAVVENTDIKKKVFSEVSQIVPADAILCSNTSALSVTEMAAVTKNPANVVGFHFFNPVHRMPLIEIIQAKQTSPETIASAFYFARQLGKTPILVQDSCGFLVNRILLGYMNEAGHLLEEGGSIEFLDKVMIDFGMPMGPFTLSDEVGLDVGIKVLHILEKAFGSRFKPVETFEKVFAKGAYGKKSGKGFYLYSKIKTVNPEVLELLKQRKNSALNSEECVKRMVYIMINEAARCLEDKIVDGPDAVDLGMIMGTGFPPFRGGLLRYAQSIGIEKIVSDLDAFALKLGSDRFKPCRFLTTLKTI